MGSRFSRYSRSRASSSSTSAHRSGGGSSRLRGITSGLPRLAALWLQTGGYGCCQDCVSRRNQWRAGRGSKRSLRVNLLASFARSPSGSKTERSARNSAYLQLQPCRERQGAAQGCTQSGSRLYPAPTCSGVRGPPSGAGAPLHPGPCGPNPQTRASTRESPTRTCEAPPVGARRRAGTGGSVVPGCRQGRLDRIRYRIRGRIRLNPVPLVLGQGNRTNHSSWHGEGGDLGNQV